MSPTYREPDPWALRNRRVISWTAGRALVGMRCYLEVQPPGQPGVKVPPHPYTYRVMVPCVLCGEIHELSDLIRDHQGGDQE